MFCPVFSKYKPLTFPGKLGVEASFHTGEIFKHTPNFQPSITGPSYAADVSVFKQTDGSKAWQRKLHYPEIGGGLFLVFHHNHDTLGHGLAAYMFWKYWLVRSKVVDFTLKTSAGITYSTKHYNAESNPYDNVLGAALNVFVQLRVDLEWKIAPQFRLVTAAAFSHYSDCAIKLPNLGINTPTGMIGLIYYPGNKPLNVQRDSFDRHPHYQNELYARTTVGFLDVTKFVNDRSHLMESTSIGYSRYINITNKLSGGLTMEFNFGEPYIYVNTLEVQNKRLKKAASELSVHLSDEILIGRVAMHMEAGAYLYHTYRMPLPVYFRIGGACYLPEIGKSKRSQLFVMGLMKAHGSTAQLAETGFGGTWKF